MANMEHGVYKYVIVEQPATKFYFTAIQSGRSHASLLDKGEVAAHAGFVSCIGDGGWIHGNSVSETLNIDGSPEHDIEHLTGYFGRAPE